MPSISIFEDPWFIYLWMKKEGLVDMLFCFFHCRVINTTLWDLKKNPPETMDVAFLFWNHKKNRPAFTSTQSASPQHWTLNWFILNVYLIVISFFQLIWFILNTGMTFLFWNHSIIAQHVFTSTQSASPRDWVLNCIYVSLFIHSFIHLFIFFFTIIYLFHFI